MGKAVRKLEVRQEREAAIQLPLAGIIQEKLHEFVVGAGMALDELLEQDRTVLCGERYKHLPGRSAGRAGTADGELTLGGRRVSVRRPRVRTGAGKELELPTWRHFSNEDPLSRRAVEQMVVGVSTRKYRRSLEDVPAPLKTRGASKSAVSRRFVAATKARLDEWAASDLSKLDLSVLMIDGIHFADHVILVALGIDGEGAKHVLGFTEGATENSAACTSLLTALRKRGMTTEKSILAVIDGSGALAKALRDVFGSRVLIQRCQVHKKRNVLEHLPATARDSVGAAISQAYASGDRDRARRLLKNLAARLQNDHPGAAGSMLEGLDETLTVMAMKLPKALERKLATTNGIENLMGTARRVSRRVARWRGGAMILRWVGASMVEAVRGFRRVQGYQGLKQLSAVLADNDWKLDETLDKGTVAA